MNIIERYKKPTPKFFKIIRNLGIGMIISGATILAAPVALPAVLLTIATYITVAGTVVTAVSQAVVSDASGEENKSNQDLN
ncbi:membrane protein [Aequorivita aquimaris]|uniref:Membrane protein n=1 Tax=Aequorivita aquimaris TaxID=1548749 RepID=A0A137RLV1_9FLAO|nr:hypothetical protein [Aequorivita aquimaris]KXO01147.1 membrane protein [Aequorivita aquimaris]